MSPEEFLNAIAQKLNPQDKVEDGIITVSGYRSVYLSRDKEDNGIMYHVNNGEIEFVEGNAIRGILSKVSTYIKNEGDRKTESEKLSFYFDCSQSKYRLEVGIDRIAGKDILMDLVTLSSSALQNPITVAFKRGDDVVFARVMEAQRDRANCKYNEVSSKYLLEEVKILLGQEDF